VGVDINGPGGGGDGGRVGAPENVGGGDESIAMSGHVMCLAEQVGEGEANVKCGIAEVDHLVVEEDQFSIVDENIFRAVIAVHEAEAAGPGGLDELVQELSGLRDLLGGVAVIGLDTKRFEE